MCVGGFDSVLRQLLGYVGPGIPWGIVSYSLSYPEYVMLYLPTYMGLYSQYRCVYVCVCGVAVCTNQECVLTRSVY